MKGLAIISNAPAWYGVASESFHNYDNIRFGLNLYELFLTHSKKSRIYKVN